MPATSRARGGAALGLTDTHALLQRADELGDVLRRSARLEAKANTTELKFDQPGAARDARPIHSRQQRARVYQFDRQKILLRTRLRSELLGLAVQSALRPIVIASSGAS